MLWTTRIAETEGLNSMNARAALQPSMKRMHDVLTYYAQQASDNGRALGLHYHATSLTILVFW